MKGIRNAHGMLLYFLFLYTYIISFFVQQFQRLVFLCGARNRDRYRDKQSEKERQRAKEVGSSFPIYTHVLYVQLVAIVYWMYEGLQFNLYAKYLPCSLLLSSFCRFLHCVFNLHLHSREINFLMHFHFNFRRFFCRFFLAICTYVCNCISLNYIRVYMAVLKNFPFCFDLFFFFYFIIFFFVFYSVQSVV